MVFASLRSCVNPFLVFVSLRSCVNPFLVFASLRSCVNPFLVFASLRSCVNPFSVFVSLTSGVNPFSVFVSLRSYVNPFSVFVSLRSCVNPFSVFVSLRSCVNPFSVFVSLRSCVNPFSVFVSLRSCVNEHCLHWAEHDNYGDISPVFTNSLLHMNHPKWGNKPLSEFSCLITTITTRTVSPCSNKNVIANFYLLQLSPITLCSGLVFMNNCKHFSILVSRLRHEYRWGGVPSMLNQPKVFIFILLIGGKGLHKSPNDFG